MNCRVGRLLWQQHLDGNGPPGPAGTADLERHLAECPDCALDLVSARRLSEGLRLLPSPVPPPGLTERITAAVLADSARRRPSPRLSPFRGRVASLVGMAAAAVVLLAVGWLSLHRAGRPQEPGLSSGLPHPHRNPADRPTVPLRESVAEAGSAVAEWTRRTADVTMLPSGSLLSAAGQTFEPMPMPLEESEARPLAEAGAGVSSGLEPVAGSLKRAFGMMLHDLPMRLPAPGTDKTS